MGEIALAILKDRVRREPVHLGNNLKREFGNAAERIGVPAEELKEFARSLYEGALEEALS